MRWWSVAGAPEQGLIGRVLDQGMLEGGASPGAADPFGAEERLLQLVRSLLQGRLVPGSGDGLEQGIGKLPPQVAQLR